MEDFQLISQLIWLSVYLVGIIIVGGATASLFMKIREQTGINEKPCFYWGYALTPFVIGIYMLFMSFLPVKLPYYVYVFVLYCIGAVILVRNRQFIQVLPRWHTADSYDENFWCLGVVSATLMIISCFWEQINFMVQNSGVFFLFFMLSGLFLVVVLTSRFFVTKICKYTYWCVFIAGYICVYMSKFFSDKRQAALDTGNNAAKWSMFGLLFLFFFLMSAIILFLLYFRCGQVYRKNENLVLKALPLFFTIFIGFLVVHELYFTNGRKRKTADLLFLLAVLAVLMLYNQIMKAPKENVIYLLCMISIGYLITIILRSCLVPVLGSDAIEYLSNALKFTESMNFSGINNFNGVADGSLLAIIHHPGWVLYLAYSLLFTNPGQMGYPCDFVARFSIEMTLIYMILACLGFLELFKRRKNVYIGAVLLFLYNNIAIIYNNHTRDGYRIIPLIIWGGVLLSTARLIKKGQRLTISVYCINALICMCVMMGHPINAIQSVAVGGALFVWLLCSRLFRKEVFIWGISCIVGAALGCYQIIWAFISTGKATGVKIDIDRLLEGTDYYANYMRYTEGRLDGADTYLERLGRILEQDHGILVITSVVAAIFVICYLVKKRNAKSSMFFFSLLILFQSLVYVDLLGWSGIKFTEWCVMNIRYTLQMYVFYGLYLGVIIDRVIDKLPYGRRWILCFLAIFCCMPVWIFNRRWEGSQSYQKIDDCVAGYRDVKLLAAEMSPGKILIDNYFCNYYLDDQAITFFADPAEQIRKASDQEALYRELKADGYCMILITDTFRDVYWKDTLMENLTESPKYIRETFDKGDFNVYIIR